MDTESISVKEFGKCNMQIVMHWLLKSNFSGLIRKLLYSRSLTNLKVY